VTYQAGIYGEHDQPVATPENVFQTPDEAKAWVESWANEHADKESESAIQNTARSTMQKATGHGFSQKLLNLEDKIDKLKDAIDGLDPDEPEVADHLAGVISSLNQALVNMQHAIGAQGAANRLADESAEKVSKAEDDGASDSQGKVKSHACDGGHDDASEVRRLDIGSGGAVNVCRQHYQQEIAFRKERNKKLDDNAKFDLPTWSSLPIVYDE